MFPQVLDIRITRPKIVLWRERPGNIRGRRELQYNERAGKYVPNVTAHRNERFPTNNAKIAPICGNTQFSRCRRVEHLGGARGTYPKKTTVPSSGGRGWSVGYTTWHLRFHPSSGLSCRFVPWTQGLDAFVRITIVE
jgi:hypothetical protein